MKWVWLVFLCSYSLTTLAQEEPKGTFQISVSTDTILLGNFFEVQFSMEDAVGKFEPPSFEDFDILGGPNQSSSMRIINGVTSQSASYSYLLRPKKTGLLHISPGYLRTKDQTHETAPQSIICLPNPEGIVQESRLRKGTQGNDRIFSFPEPAPPKKKLKVTKI